MTSRIRSVQRYRRIAVASTAILSIAASGLAGASYSSAAATIGQTFDPTLSCSGQTWIQTTSPSVTYTVPSNGVITSWGWQADAIALTARLKVARPAGGGNSTIVGESSLQSAPAAGFNSFNTRVSVQAGDLIGLHVPSGTCLRSMAGHTVHQTPGDTGVGGTVPAAGATSGFQLDASAVVETDADNDGFGDETQDQCPTDATTQGACPLPPGGGADTTAPDTTITGQPKAKTKKKAATFEFAGTDARAVASFECSLNGAPFTSCTSPVTVKGKKGKNAFAVRAKDAAGNVDATPAAFDWKVKKKK